MLNLAGVLDNSLVSKINEMTSIRFKNPGMFRTPESLILYEQNYIDSNRLLEICQELYPEVVLQEPPLSVIPVNLVEHFRNSKLVPMSYSFRENKLVLCYVLEYGVDDVEDINVDYTIVPTTLHHYIKAKINLYYDFEELLEVTGKLALDLIIEEAISQKVADMTISSRKGRTIVYYNKGKKRIDSRLLFSGSIINDIIKVLTISTPVADATSTDAKYVGYQIDEFYRSRVVINKTIQGYSITMRIYSNEQFNATMESLNLGEELIEFLRSPEYSKNNGLRLIVGETMSGKNTTALTILNRVVSDGDKKVVSIEMPVEQIIDGVEQIDAEDIESYISNINSLIHQNPDFVYIAETKDVTAKEVMRIANTGKRVLTTLHANSVVDTIFRLMDITGLSANRIIQVLHSIIFQQLVNVNGQVYPLNRFVLFSDELKNKLYDKSFGEIINIVRSYEKGDEL